MQGRTGQCGGSARAEGCTGPLRCAFQRQGWGGPKDGQEGRDSGRAPAAVQHEEAEDQKETQQCWRFSRGEW